MNPTETTYGLSVASLAKKLNYMCRQTTRCRRPRAFDTIPQGEKFSNARKSQNQQFTVMGLGYSATEAQPSNQLCLSLLVHAALSLPKFVLPLPLKGCSSSIRECIP